MTLISDLKPTDKPRLIDLLNEVGLDTSDWSNVKGGAAKAATNPKYCYEWAFIEQGKLAVLNIWIDSLNEQSGKIECQLNLRNTASKFESTKPLVARRATKMDKIISEANEQNIPIRVIIGERNLSEIENDNANSSVQKRRLDEEFWRIGYYNQDTGDCMIMRGESLVNIDSIYDLSVADYIKAFEIIKLNDKEKELLIEIYNSINHEANARELAQKRLGYQSLLTANQAIGGVAQKILDALSLETIKTDEKKRKHKLLVLVDRHEKEDRIIWRMKPELARALELLGMVDPRADWEPYTDEELAITSDKIVEGGRKAVTVNVYERSTKAKRLCIAAHGVNCSVCNFNFEKTYGEIGKGFVHVHHLVPISEIGEAYEIDPVKDLRPVCPNCHAMLHRSNKVLSINELKEKLKS